MTKPKKPSIPIDASVYQTMASYAETHGLPLSDLVARMWQLWLTVDQTHGTLYPSKVADGQRDNSLEQFLDEMQAQADDVYSWWRNRQSGRFVAASRPEEDERKGVIDWLNDTDILNC